MFANKASLFGNPKNSKLDVIHLQGVALERLKLELEEHQALTGYLRCVRGNASAHIQSACESRKQMRFMKWMVASNSANHCSFHLLKMGIDQGAPNLRAMVLNCKNENTTVHASHQAFNDPRLDRINWFKNLGWTRQFQACLGSNLLIEFCYGRLGGSSFCAPSKGIICSRMFLCTFWQSEMEENLNAVLFSTANSAGTQHLTLQRVFRHMANFHFYWACVCSIDQLLILKKISCKLM